MMLVRTYVAPSRIHGLGIFAAEPVAEAQPIWEYHPAIDRRLEREEAAVLPEPARAFLETYAYMPSSLPGVLALDGDHARFMNHSEQPNTDFTQAVGVARSAIAAGTEITCDYREFCAREWQDTYLFLSST